MTDPITTDDMASTFLLAALIMSATYFGMSFILNAFRKLDDDVSGLRAGTLERIRADELERERVRQRQQIRRRLLTTRKAARRPL